MKIKITLLALSICLFEAHIWAGCFNFYTRVCHAATPGGHFTCPDGALVTTNSTTQGTVTSAKSSSTGLDSLGYYDTTCDYSIKNEDCFTAITTTPQSDPIVTYYAKGNPCGG